MTKDVIIPNELGIHARPAVKIVNIAKEAKSHVWILKNTIRVDAADILDVLTLSCPKGTKITIKIDNKSDINILNDIVKLVESGFGE
ncbi:MAG: HPr family phosphocarrier protein [Desulfobacterales bacterium]|nr:HPr family phosphocarrier protein [Desulfobacterales bacterium]MBF0395510.1 HPr family phosphocarrier protein [Desulfobacterales bacterium]